LTVKADSRGAGRIEPKVESTVARHQGSDVHGGPDSRAERTGGPDRVSDRRSIVVVDRALAPAVVRYVPDVVARAGSTVGVDAQGDARDGAINTLDIEAQVTPHDRRSIRTQQIGRAVIRGGIGLIHVGICDGCKCQYDRPWRSCGS
jgi:hypothetical protein